MAAAWQGQISKKFLHKNVFYSKKVKFYQKRLDFDILLIYNRRVSKNLPIFDIWPHGQVVKTSPFHGGIRGSSPLEATNFI